MSMQNCVIRVLTLCGILFCAHSTMAAADVYEGFDYAAGSSILSATGGSGWSGGWVDSFQNNHLEVLASDVIATTPTLPYSDIQGNQLVSTGNHLNFDLDIPSTFTSESAIERTLSAPYGADGTTMYFSMLVGPSIDAGLDRTFQLGSAKFSAYGWGAREWKFNDVSTGIVRAGNGAKDFVVVKITFNSGDDTVEFWVNPPLGELPEANLTTTLAMSVGKLVLQQQNQSGGSHGLMFDEIRFGATYRDVAPTVDAPVLPPEPATFYYEGFEYTSGTALEGLAGGKGWQGGWVWENPFSAPDWCLTVTNGLSYVDADNNPLHIEDGAALINSYTNATGGSRAAMRRTMQTRFTTDTPTYFSCLIKPTVINGAIDYGLELRDGSASKLGFYIRGWAADWRINDDGTGKTGLAKPQKDETQFIVIGLTASETEGVNTLSLWINPNLKNPGAAHYSTTIAHFGLDNVRFWSQLAQNQSSQVEIWDEIRIGRSFSSVAPYGSPRGTVILIQ